MDKIKYKIVVSHEASKDIIKIKNAKLYNQLLKIISTISENPYTPPYEKLVGDLKGVYSRRINIKHRLLYEVIEDIKTIKILSMWTHYE